MQIAASSSAEKNGTALSVVGVHMKAGISLRMDVVEEAQIYGTVLVRVVINARMSGKTAQTQSRELMRDVTWFAPGLIWLFVRHLSAALQPSATYDE